MISRCRVCGSFSSSALEYCHYCGYSFRYSSNKDLVGRELYLASDNVGKKPSILARHPYRRDNILLRRHSLFDKIVDLRKKIEGILVHLQNVVNPDSRERINLLLSKMRDHLGELVILRVAYEFEKFVGSRNALIRELRNLQPSDIDGYLSELDDQFLEWKKGLSQVFDTPTVQERLQVLTEKWLRLKEELALGAITTILKDTSLASSSVELDGADLGAADGEIQKIQYELDRLNAELQM